MENKNNDLKSEDFNPINKIEESSNENKFLKTYDFKQINQKYSKKRNYNEMMNSILSSEINSNFEDYNKKINIENEIASYSDKSKPFKKKPKNKIYPRLLNEVEGKHYYFTNHKNTNGNFSK